ncbi:MAG TPA: hypothetical protein VM577_04970 [Anaerovoracaceae bacterium]|nr:hypothetical protein [Anaerovoracaceae bacterium]
MDIPFSFNSNTKEYGVRVLKAIFLEEHLFAYGFDQQAFFGAKVTVKAYFNKNFNQRTEEIRHIERTVWVHRGDLFPWSSWDDWYEEEYHQALIKQALLELAIDQAGDYSKWCDSKAQKHLFGRILFAGHLTTSADISEYLGILNKELEKAQTILEREASGEMQEAILDGPCFWDDED